MKKISAVFLLLVLSIQVLPVQQMGMALFSNRFTEELPHSFDSGKDVCKKADGKSDFITTPIIDLTHHFSFISFASETVADAIPLNHAGDIHVPPPNC